VISDLVRTRE